MSICYCYELDRGFCCTFGLDLVFMIGLVLLELACTCYFVVYGVFGVVLNC